jgi:hypothetical protein
MSSGARRLAADTAGASLTEYALIAGTIVLAGYAAFRLLGGNNEQDAQCGADLVAGGSSRCTPGSASSQPVALNALPSKPAHGGNSDPQGGYCTRTGCYGGKHCFVAGTQVLTPEGMQPIETLRPGDQVLSADADTGVLLYRPVTAIFETPDRPLVDVSVADEREPIRATPGHPFYTLDRGWVQAASLVPGEPLGESPGSSSRHPTLSGVGVVESIAATSDRATVFNLEVEGSHSYFVGPAHVLVHNTDCTPFAPTSPAASDPGDPGPVAGNDSNPATSSSGPGWVTSLQKFNGNKENGHQVTFVKAPYPTSSNDVDVIKHSKEGVPPENVIVIGKNDAMPANKIEREAEIDAARRIVQDYLYRIGEAGTIGPVQFSRPNTFASGVEGVTDPGTHLIRINGGFHTTGTIVHEMFHSLSHPAHDSVFNVSNPVNEGLTEYLTNEATGHDRRYARDGTGTYTAEAEAIRRAIQSGAITDEDVRNAYFRGDRQAIAKVSAAADHELPAAEQARRDRWAGEHPAFVPWLVHGPPTRGPK